MKLIIYSYFILTLLACSASKDLAQEGNDSSKYLIKKIKAKNSWYVIYAQRQDSLYKIVTARENGEHSNCQKIAVGKYYNFKLQSRKENAPEIGGVKLNPINYLDVECYQYDEETNICIEPKKGIYDLYYTADLNGLCYLK